MQTTLEDVWESLKKNFALLNEGRNHMANIKYDSFERKFREGQGTGLDAIDASMRLRKFGSP